MTDFFTYKKNYIMYMNNCITVSININKKILFSREEIHRQARMGNSE